MKLLRPAHNIPSTKVRNWAEIKDEARALRELVLREDHEGDYSRAYAISHCQVSENPKWFFVVNETLNDPKTDKNLAKIFGSWCIINAEIVETDTPVEWKEACMSFPHRKPKNTKRFLNIKVRYQIPILGGWLMVWRTKRFSELPSFIFQHEQEHAIGTNIYGITNQSE